VRLLIVDDNPAFLEAAQTLLEKDGMTVVGVATSSQEALEQIRRLRPEVALIDIDLGDESGFDVARRLAGGAEPAPSVLIISSHDGDDFEDLIDGSPALGFVSKASLSGDAIRAVLELNGRPT
jgi:DNA-binding NarL/FixJ family response regulator